MSSSKLEVILSVLGERIAWPASAAAIAQPAVSPRIEAPTGIAVIPVIGSLVRRTMGLDPMSGLTSYAEIATMVDAALADPSVEGILLDIDSPGGEAGGVFELGEHIRAADAVKPVWAMASDAAYSAAYAIACGASRLCITRTGGVGSIGVIAMHVDQSVRDAQQGYRYTAITAGDQKNDFSPHEKLDQAAHARLQSEVDRLYGMFVNHVAALRQLEPDAVRATEAGTYFGEDAVRIGLADSVSSLDGVLNEFGTFLAASRTRPRAERSTSRSLAATIPSLQKENIMNSTEIVAVPPVVEPEELPDSNHPAVAPAQDMPLPVDAHSTHPVADALAIAELCQLAGHSELTAGFLAANTSEAQVRKTLLAARADSVEISSCIAPDSAASTATTHATSNPLLSAIRKLSGKD